MGGSRRAVQNPLRHRARGVQHRPRRRRWARRRSMSLPKLSAASNQTGGYDAASKGPPLPGNGGAAWGLRAHIHTMSTTVIQPEAYRRLADARRARLRCRIIATPRLDEHAL